MKTCWMLQRNICNVMIPCGIKLFSNTVFFLVVMLDFYWLISISAPKWVTKQERAPSAPYGAPVGH